VCITHKLVLRCGPGLMLSCLSANRLPAPTIVLLQRPQGYLRRPQAYCIGHRLTKVHLAHLWENDIRTQRLLCIHTNSSWHRCLCRDFIYLMVSVVVLGIGRCYHQLDIATQLKKQQSINGFAWDPHKLLSSQCRSRS
jgi:hypothetical protein